MCLNEACSKVCVDKNLSYVPLGNQEGWKLNGTYSFLVCTDDVNLLDKSMNAINKSTGTLLDVRKKKTKYIATC
jgi:hypothetical protein